MNYTGHGILQARIWSGQSFHCLGDLPNPGIEPGSPALLADSLPTETSGKEEHYPATPANKQLMQDSQSKRRS